MTWQADESENGENENHQGLGDAGSAETAGDHPV
jgi:hypothetical protein